MSRPDRRQVLRGGALALVGAALAAPAAVAASRATGSGASHAGHAGHGDHKSAAPDVPEAFDEVYLGRHIEGWPSAEGPGGGGHGGHGGHEGMAFTVRVDNDDLHVMQNVDSTWISVVNHYETHASPRSVARAAVRELNGSDLVLMVGTG
ncbi:tyrosinase family oxidase copper chaperone [Streptomyces sp. NPDC047108]|uniref:apotyrosinase chaperone MelC1 n=1 Tax=Streptomyces sp. NPDC047108 TaxID=3155025 RepID=UPI0033E6F3A1